MVWQAKVGKSIRGLHALMTQIVDGKDAPCILHSRYPLTDRLLPTARLAVVLMSVTACWDVHALYTGVQENLAVTDMHLRGSPRLQTHCCMISGSVTGSNCSTPCTRHAACICPLYR